MKMKLLLSSLAVTAIVGLACAQDGQGGPPPGGPPPGGGFGGPGGQRGMGPGGGMGLMPADRLVQRSDVQTEINLTSDQKTQIQDLQQSMRAKMDAMRQSSGSDDREAQRKAFDSVQKENRAAIEKILTDDQKKRVKEIAIQMAGNRAILDADVQKDLNLSSDQVSKIKTLMSGFQAAGQAVREKQQNGEIDRDAARQSMQNNAKALDSSLAAILTSDQKSSLKSMGGKHFEATSQGFGGGPGGFGGPGGGGPGGPGGPGGGGPGGPPPGGPGDGGPGGPPPGDGPPQD